MKEVKKVILVVMEQLDLQKAVQLPFLNHLSKAGALLTRYYALTHPSQPNYIALISGDTQGVKTDQVYNLEGHHIGDLLEKKKLKWKAFSEAYPGNCFLEDLYTPQGKSTPSYYRIHMPFLSFLNIQNQFSRCNDLVVGSELFDLGYKTAQLPDFSFYVPASMTNTASLQEADQWLSARFSPLVQDQEAQRSILFIITSGEGVRPDQHPVYTVFLGAGIRPGATSSRTYNHYSLLLTLEKIFHLDSFGNNDSKAQVIDDIWTRE